MKKITKTFLFIICFCVCVVNFSGCMSACRDFTDHNDGKCDICFTADAETHVGKYETCLSCLWEIGTSD